ncbi:MAG: hypothetical protein KC800_15100 [Candidatus Eremiobacteraeota bacterium]|nr:hypothetical protein [Candidatus Eremiobacteraeota bacterium]
MRFLVVFVFVFLVGCSPAPATPPTTATPVESPQSLPSDKVKVPARETDAPAQQSLTKKESPIPQPSADWQPSKDDFATLDHLIGGVAGTDSNVLKVQGDGTVTLTSSRQPHGNESSSSGTLSPEETRALFVKLLESKLLEMNEVSGSTVGTTLMVQINGVQDTVVVTNRQAETEAIFGVARAALVEK